MEKLKLWLVIPAEHVTTPVLYELGKKFDVVPNIRQASVTAEMGIVCVELEGERKVTHDAIRWLEELGVKVDPVEIQIIEG